MKEVLEGSKHSCCDSSPGKNRVRMWSYLIYVLEGVAYSSYSSPSLSLHEYILNDFTVSDQIRPKRQMHQLVTSTSVLVCMLCTLVNGVGVVCQVHRTNRSVQRIQGFADSFVSLQKWLHSREQSDFSMCAT